jgi:hypothetical protein
VKESVDQVLDSMTLADLCCGTDGPNEGFVSVEQVKKKAGSARNQVSCFVAQ